jgi:Yip1-like protein
MKGARMSTHVSAEAPAPSFVSSLGNLLIAPREAFTGILRRPSPWLPLALFVALHVVFAAVWLPKLDMIQLIRYQQEASGKELRLPPESMAAGIKIFTGVVTLVAPPLFVLATAGCLYLIFRFFYGSDVSFKQAFTICAYVFTILALVQIPLMLLVYALKGDWSLPPETLLMANAAALLPAKTAKWLYSLAQSVDLFKIWAAFLLSSGFAVAMRKPTGSAVPGIVGPWLFLVAIGVGIAALMG